MSILYWLVCLFLSACLLVCLSPILFMLLIMVVFMNWILTLDDESIDESEIT